MTLFLLFPLLQHHHLPVLFHLLHLLLPSGTCWLSCQQNRLQEGLIDFMHGHKVLTRR